MNKAGCRDQINLGDQENTRKPGSLSADGLGIRANHTITTSKNAFNWCALAPAAAT